MGQHGRIVLQFLSQIRRTLRLSPSVSNIVVLRLPWNLTLRGLEASKKAFREYTSVTARMNRPILRGVTDQEDILGARVQRGGLAPGLGGAGPYFSE